MTDYCQSELVFPSTNIFLTLAWRGLYIICIAFSPIVHNMHSVFAYIRPHLSVGVRESVLPGFCRKHARFWRLWRLGVPTGTKESEGMT